jgi:fructokinase
MTDAAVPSLSGYADASFPQFVSAGDLLTDMIRTGPSSWLSRPGGAGWNVARAVAKLGRECGVRSACAASLGTDCFSDELWRESEVAGLDMRFLQRNALPPLLAIVHQSDPPDYFFMGANGADLAFDPSRLPDGWTGHVRWAHFGGISLARQPLGDTLATLAATLHAGGVQISFDPNYRNLMAHGYQPMLQRMAALADLIKVSDEDLEALFGVDNHDAAVARLRALNPRATLLVTCGPGAAALYADGVVHRAEPPRVDVVDTVGAGDASIGGLLFSLMTAPRRSWPQHLEFALAAGAAACRHAGAYAPALDEVLALAGRI